MIARRRVIFALGASVLAVPLRSFAQQRGKVWRIGFLGPSSAASAASRVAALRAGLRDLGYVEGKNMVMEFRWANDRYDLLPKLAADLAGQAVDVIVTYGTPGSRAAKQATATIPIVMGHVGDAVLVGLVANLARPDGNVTGSTFFNPELAAKRLDVLKDAFPRIRRVGVLQNPDNPSMEPVLKEMDRTAKSLKLELLIVPARLQEDIEQAFAAMAAKRVGAVVVVEDAMLNGNIRKIADLATKHKLPAIGLPELAEAGALMAYGVDLVQMFRRAAHFVDKILKGTKLAELPVERATKFELIVNMKTAKALGITFPQSILLRADRVIE